ncbi:MAG: response regulator [Candidatus Brocadiae bacterium]|nr:response regulator [Candidatus Brocadiia bacterium]
MTPPASPPQPLSVLVYHASPMDAHLLWLKLAGIEGWTPECFAFEDVDQAAAALARRTMDAAIIDHSVPQAEALRALERFREAADAPVLVLTASDHEQAAVEMMMAGAADCMPCHAVSSSSLQRALTNATEQHRLSQAIREYHTELERRQTEARRTIHTLAHELKTPLMSARELLAVVLDGLAGPLAPPQEEYLGLAVESCDQLHACINTLLDVTRLETGKLTLQRQPTHLAELTARWVAAMEPLADEKGIHLRHDAEPGLPPADADQTRIAQVVTNLLSNALKFTPAGGEVTLRVHRRREHPGCLVVSIHDTGRGIPHPLLNRIFDRLYQARPSDDAVLGGVGMGLSICKELIALHGGDIWAKSASGHGSTFAFTLPIHVPAAPHDVPMQRNTTDEDRPGGRGRQEDFVGVGRAAQV